MWKEKLGCALVLRNDNLCYHHLLSKIKAILGYFWMHFSTRFFDAFVFIFSVDELAWLLVLSWILLIFVQEGFYGKDG